MTANEELKKETLQWLSAGRSSNEIADKFVEAVNKTYDLTIERHQVRLKEKLFEVLTAPTPKPNKAWWSF